MIRLVVTRPHSYTVTTFLESYGRALRGELRFVYYDRFLRARRFPEGVYVFGDLERLAPGDAEKAAISWERLREHGCRVLNHPTRALRRFELLRRLASEGRSDFDVCRVTERRAPRRFPVFLRRESEHSGPESGLIRTPEELEGALRALDERGGSREDRLIVEFCDVSDGEGLFRKYSAFRVGRRIVPRHLFFSRDWVQKEADIAGAAQLAEEREFVEGNPHGRELLDLFDRARIEYGRADYGLRGGRIQLWEINTNPMLVSRGGAAIPDRRPVHEAAARALEDAFRAL